MMATRALLLLAAAAGAAGAAPRAASYDPTSQAQLRIINEVVVWEELFVWRDAISSSTQIAGSLAPHLVTDYVPVAAGVIRIVVSDSQKPASTNNVTLPSVTFVAGASYTLLTTDLHDLRHSVVGFVSLDNVTRPSEDPIDTCEVRLMNALVSNATLWGNTVECYKCVKRQLVGPTPVGPPSPRVLIDARWAYDFEVRSPNGTVLASALAVDVREHAVYSILLHNEMPASVLVVTETEGDDVWVALSAAAGLTVVAWCSVKAYQCAGRHQRPVPGYELDAQHGVSGLEVMQAQSHTKTRVLAIDTFRGIALSIMIFVNYGGGGYWFFDHSRWNGLTVADLVFPWFMWIMGTSMALSLDKHTDRNRSAMLKKIVTRSAKLYGLGLFLNNGSDLSNWRIPGVLQYFGVSYLACGLVQLLVPRTDTLHAEEPAEDHGDLAPYRPMVEPEQAGKAARPTGRFSDISPYALQYIPFVIFLAIYLCVQFLLAVPGCGAGYLGPGGDGDGGLHRGCTGGAHGYVDRAIFGVAHIYHGMEDGVPVSAATCADVYECDVYDPEGTLGYLTAAVLCWLGVQAGRILVHHTDHRARVVRWVAWGAALTLIGGAMCGFAKNGGAIPINKNLWSPSFVLVMSGLGFLVLALTYAVIDAMKLWGGAPFRFVGMNSILVYCGSELLGGNFPFVVYLEYSPSGAWSSHAAALVSNILGVASWQLVAYLLYSNNFFYNV